MKKIAFLVVSAVLASVSFCANATEKVVSQFTGKDPQIEEQSRQPLVLQSSLDFNSHSSLLGHSSHSSHASHSSHSSHASHSSHSSHFSSF